MGLAHNGRRYSLPSRRPAEILFSGWRASTVSDFRGPSAWLAAIGPPAPAMRQAATAVVVVVVAASTRFYQNRGDRSPPSLPPPTSLMISKIFGSELSTFFFLSLSPRPMYKTYGNRERIICCQPLANSIDQFAREVDGGGFESISRFSGRRKRSRFRGVV